MALPVDNSGTGPEFVCIWEEIEVTEVDDAFAFKEDVTFLESECESNKIEVKTEYSIREEFASNDLDLEDESLAVHLKKEYETSEDIEIKEEVKTENHEQIGSEDTITQNLRDRDSECDCAIEKLLRSPFKSLSYSQKLQTIQDGPPQHILTITTKLKKCIRHFSENIYKSEYWLCGCKVINKLFCWPCLLFSKEKNVWNSTGYTDLNNIYRTGKSHKNSANHISCEKALLLFGKDQEIEFTLSTAPQYRLNIEKHNEVVKQNRQILGHLVRVTCLLGKLGLPFRGHNESGISKKKGNFVEFVNEIARNDDLLKTHLDNSTVFRGLSPDIQNDLIFSVGEVITSKIKDELLTASFVALILDEASDISMKSQLSATFRYVIEDGNVEERFVRFTDFSTDRTAVGLLQHTLQILKDFGCTDKLVALTYDGAAVITREHNCLQTRLREHCKTAMFIHCYARKLNLVLAQSASFIKEVEVFFTNLSSFSAFFAKSPKRTHALDVLVKNAPSRWNFQSQIVQTVKEHKQDLETLLQTIVENDNGDWDRETTVCARGLSTLLRDYDFNFFLTVFSSIFTHHESVFKILQRKVSDINFCSKKIDHFKLHIQKIRNEFDAIWENMDQFVDNNQPPRKRMHLDEDRKSTYARLFYEILDVIILNVDQRFCEISKLKFLNLLDSTQFTTFAQSFPEKLFSALLETYGTFFDVDRLKNELSVIYRDSDMKKSSVFEIHKYIMSLQLSSVFPEASKLIRLILTISTTNNSTKRSFTCSYLKRTKTHLRRSQKQERLSALALMNIESALLENLRLLPSFEETVMEVFAKQNNRRIDLDFIN